MIKGLLKDYYGIAKGLLMEHYWGIIKGLLGITKGLQWDCLGITNRIVSDFYGITTGWLGYY